MVAHGLTRTKLIRTGKLNEIWCLFVRKTKTGRKRNDVSVIGPATAVGGDMVGLGA